MSLLAILLILLVIFLVVPAFTFHALWIVAVVILVCIAVAAMRGSRL